MEDVLAVYARPLDPRRPLVCLDETNKQQLDEVHTPLPMQPGQPTRYDTEYVRTGLSTLFMFFAPLLNWRHVDVTDRRPSSDWAQCMQDLVDVHFPEAERLVLVLDNLNPHTPAALSTTFEPTEAKRIWDRLEIHSTPKRGSWLNMAEIELSGLARQGLNRRIPDQPTLRRHAAAWETDRNAQRATVNWQFTTTDARVKLKRLYPSIIPV